MSDMRAQLEYAQKDREQWRGEHRELTEQLRESAVETARTAAEAKAQTSQLVEKIKALETNISSLEAKIKPLNDGVVALKVLSKMGAIASVIVASIWGIWQVLRENIHFTLKSVIVAILVASAAAAWAQILPR